MKPRVGRKRRTAGIVLGSVLTTLTLGAGTIAWGVETKQHFFNNMFSGVPMIGQWSTPAQPEAEPPAKQWQKQRFSFTTAVPGNLFYPSDRVKGTLTALQPIQSTTILATVTVLDERESPVAKPRSLALSKANGYTVSFDLPKGLGYYRIALEVGGQWHQFDARYAVIPASVKASKTPASPFGVNTHFNQGWSPAVGKIVKRAGINWIRDGEASQKDRAVEVAKANNLCYMPVFTQYRAPKDTNRQADGTWDFSDVAEWHRQYALKYGADIDYYDLVNEPHIGWMKKLGGSWRGGPWQEPFVTYGRQVTQAIKAGDPNATVLWEDVDQLVWYRQFYKLGAGDVIDRISPHPYHLHRENPFPETHPMLGQLPKFHQFVRQEKLPWTVWSGEVGFSSHQGPNRRLGQAPHTELEQAQKLVRMMVGQFANGVEKIFWYDMRDDGWQQANPEHNFGLIQIDNEPKPALVAYANLIHWLQDGKWLGRVQMGNAYAYAFTSKRTSQPVLVAWTKKGAKTVTVPVPKGIDRVTLTDIYGGTQSAAVQENKLQLELTDSPVYVEGLNQQAIAPLL